MPKTNRARLLAFAVAGVLLVTALIGVVAIMFSTQSTSNSTNSLSEISIQANTSELVEQEKTTLTVSGKSVTGQERNLDKVDWASVDASIATVDTNGTVTAIAPGTTEIQATVEGKTTNKTISVVRAGNAGETVTGTIAGKTTLAKGDKTKLTATFDNNWSGDVIWTTNEASIVNTLDNDGNIEAIASGKATITARISGTNNVAIIDIIVSGNGQVLGIDVPATLDLPLGATHKLEYTLLPAGVTANVSWDIGNNTTLATIDTKAGTIKALKAGTFTLTTYVGNVYAYTRVSISDVKVDSLEIIGDETSTVNAINELRVVALPTTAWQVADWTLSDEKLATFVDEKGIALQGTVKNEGTVSFRALAKGKVTFTATRNAGVNAGANAVTDTLEVTIGDQLQATSVIITRDKNFKGDTLEIAGGSDYTLEAKVLPASARQDVKWFSHNVEFVTIDEATGVIKGQKEGAATIEARALDKDGKPLVDTITVVVTASNVNDIVSVHIVDSVNKDITKTIRVLEGNDQQLKGITRVLNNLTGVVSIDENPTAIRWQSDNAHFATIDPQTGLVTALSVGKATISARITGNDTITYATVTIEVIATPDATKVEIAGADVVPSHTRSDFTATTTPTGVENAVVWTRSAGTVTLEDKKTYDNSLQNTGVIVEFIYTDANGKEVISNTTLNEKTAKVTFATIRFSLDETITGGTGFVYITATHTNGDNTKVTALHKVTVAARPTPNTIEISKVEEANGEYTITARAYVTGKDGKEDTILSEGVKQEFEWYSTDENVVVFTDATNGTIVGQTPIIGGATIKARAIAYGTATVFVEYPNTSLRNSATITVTTPKQNIDGVNIVAKGTDPKVDTTIAQTATVYKDGTVELEATAFDASSDASMVIPGYTDVDYNGDFSQATDKNIVSGAVFHFWTSATSIATVDQDGVVTPVKSGTVTIYVEAVGTRQWGSFTVIVDMTRHQMVVDFVNNYNTTVTATTLKTAAGTLAYINSYIDRKVIELKGIKYDEKDPIVAEYARIDKLSEATSLGNFVSTAKAVALSKGYNFYEVLANAINEPTASNKATAQDMLSEFDVLVLADNNLANNVLGALKARIAAAK